MSNPIPHVVEESGDAEDAPNGSIPIALYGAGGGGEAIPAAPSSGDYVLQSSDGVIEWVEVTP